MEHPCPKCGTAVEGGVPFCKACRAPQIRVVGFAPQAAVAPPQGDVDDLLAPPPPVVPPPPLPSSIQWSQALPCAALGGAFILLLSFIPFAVFGPACVAGGALSVVLYRRKNPDAPPAPGPGALLGAISGVFGFVFFAIPAVAGLVYRADDLRKAFSDSVSQLPSRGYDPQGVQQVLDLLKTQGGLAFFLAFGLFVMFVIFTAGASIGGAWYSAWARKRIGR